MKSTRFWKGMQPASQSPRQKAASVRNWKRLQIKGAFAALHNALPGYAGYSLESQELYYLATIDQRWMSEKQAISDAEEFERKKLQGEL